MPELAEVEVISTQLNQALQGRTVRDFRVYNFGQKILFHKAPYSIPGITITRVRRQGKYILFEHDRGVLASHLAMTGSWKLNCLDPNLRSLAFALTFDHDRSLAYYDLRHFGKLFVMDSIEQLKSLANQGPDVFSKEFTAQYLRSKLVNKKTAIGAVLMDQQIFPGVGNYLKSEVLFKAKIHPRRVARRLSMPRLENLRCSLISIVQNMIQRGGLSLRDYVDTFGVKGAAAHVLSVYQAKQCRQCRHPIRRIIQASRTTWYCPECQK